MHSVKVELRFSDLVRAQFAVALRMPLAKFFFVGIFWFRPFASSRSRTTI